MRIKVLSLILLSLIFCSKDSQSPEEKTGDARFRILALDVNNEAYASGMGKIVVELNENNGDGNTVPVEKNLMISLNGAGVGEYVFRGEDLADLNDYIKIKRISVINHVFEEVGNSENEIIVDFGKTVYETFIIEAVHDCIGELKNEEEKQAVVLYYVTGKVYREIGEIFGKSISMVKKRIMSGQMKIKRCLERKGIDSFP